MKTFLDYCNQTLIDKITYIKLDSYLNDFGFSDMFDAISTLSKNIFIYPKITSEGIKFTFDNMNFILFKRNESWILKNCNIDEIIKEDKIKKLKNFFNTEKYNKPMYYTKEENELYWEMKEEEYTK